MGRKLLILNEYSFRKEIQWQERPKPGIQRRQYAIHSLKPHGFHGVAASKSDSFHVFDGMPSKLPLS
jgi:hypothetical protein